MERLQKNLCIDTSAWTTVPVMHDDETRRVDSPAALKALAHPLRVRLLSALREAGGGTATELARALDTDTGATSYHLRVLARHGFVEEEPRDQRTGRHPRERRWRSVHRLNTWDNVDLASSPAGREAGALMRRQQAEILVRDVLDFERRQAGMDPAWVAASGIGDLVVRLTPDSVNELWERFYADVDELVARDADAPAAASVSVVVAGFPRPVEGDR
jgi:DNA-binding transcriptional ArsR family regulator